MQRQESARSAGGVSRQDSRGSQGYSRQGSGVSAASGLERQDSRGSVGGLSRQSSAGPHTLQRQGTHSSQQSQRSYTPSVARSVARSAAPNAVKSATSERREEAARAYYSGRANVGYDEEIDEDGNPLGALGDYPKNTPEVIKNPKHVKTIPCLKCNNRLGYSERTALNVKCSHCGSVSDVAAAKRKERKMATRKRPPRVPYIDAIVQCKKCKAFLGVPEDVSTFQCAFCKQVNVAGVLRKQPGLGDFVELNNRKDEET